MSVLYFGMDKTFFVRAPADLHREARIRAATVGVSLSAYVRTAIERDLQNRVPSSDTVAPV